MHALYQEILPPSGVEFATSLKLTPSTLPDVTLRHEFAARALSNVVTARSNIIRIFELRQESAYVAEVNGEVEGATSEKEAEAVPGEVEMDLQGDGYLNIAKSAGVKTTPDMLTRFVFVKEHSIHGIVTGLECIKTLSTIDDKLDRLLVSFKDAKIALLEWSESVHDLVTVSIHTYERAPQMMSMDSSLFRTELRVDSLSRCAALSLPKDAIAILPFYQTQAEIDIVDQEMQARDIPYSPSFILDLPTSVDKNIRNIIDYVFLPGFNNPMIAILYQTQVTWTGRLTEFKDTVKLAIFTVDIFTQNYPIISSTENLPYDSFSLIPCTASTGGVIILAANSLIYIDQSSRRVSFPLNGWATRISDMTYPAPDDPSRCLALEGARCAFVDDKTVFIILKDGSVMPLDIVTDGKLVTKLVLGTTIAQTTIPSVVRRIDTEHIFVGSSVGPSVLMETVKVQEEIDEDEEMADVTGTSRPINDMDMDDDDDDIYGPSIHSTAASGQVDGDGVSKRKTKTVTRVVYCDHVNAYGSISDLTFSLAKNGDIPVVEVVAATGSGFLGGFTLFQRDLPLRTKRKLHAIGGGRGLWSLPIRLPTTSSGPTIDQVDQHENDTLLISTDATPSPGVSRFTSRSAKSDTSITTRIPGTTIGAGSFFQQTAILHVMTNTIRVLEPDGTERQVIKDMDSNTPRPKIRLCCISDPYVLIFREDDSIGLFIEKDRGKIRRKDISPMGEKSSKYISGCFFSDITGLFEGCLESNAAPNSAVSADKTATSTLQAAVSGRTHEKWLLLVRPQGVMEIWTLPKLSLAFSTSLVNVLHNVLVDSHDPPAVSVAQDSPRKAQPSDIENILIAPLGETSLEPHLFVFLRGGTVAIYHIMPADPTIEPVATPRSMTLNIKMVKIVSKSFELMKPDESEKSILAEQKKIHRSFIPFSTMTLPGKLFTGVFLTGDNPYWILGTDKGGVRLHSSGHKIVYSFTPCSLWESKSDFFLCSDEGPGLVEWVPDYHYDYPLPSKSIPRGRAYSSVVYEPATSLIVAAASLQAKFAAFDEDGNRLWSADAPNISDPLTDCSTLELISPDLWVTMDGYEFAMNEFVNAVSCVTLETSSTESNIKNFIAVGTTIDRGEDLAVKGCTYIFEIVEVVADPKIAPKRWYKLKLRCRDDAKGPVTALCGYSGYLVSSMGQKIFVRALDLDERLVGVAFLDVGVYVTSLRVMKNLLLIGDAVKSVSFVAFQEDPYKLVTVAKDIHHICVTDANFLFTEEELSFATSDEEGILRIYEYNPLDLESGDGRHLLLRSEFNTQVESRSSVIVARRNKSDSNLPRSKIICGTTNGSLTSIDPVEESVGKRLQLLQGQLTRNMQHQAGLNPKAFRMVRNDFVSRALSKGILDGNLLTHFEKLPTARQDEMTRQIGTESGIILRDWASFRDPF